MRFAYYRRLSRRDQAVYRQSDEWGAIELEAPGALRPIARALGEALRVDDRIAAEHTAQRLVSEACRQLNVPTASTRVLATRPRSAVEELHGLYVREEGTRPRVIVWMRTAARDRPVAHRAFVRTLMHELCHHLDYELLDLADSFHTHGFFQRESSLVRQVLPRRAPPEPRPRPTQLELPLS